MAHRRTSPFEVLFEVAAKLPWWAAVGAGVLMYFVLSAFAGPGNPKEPVSIVIGAVAGILRYLVPAAFFAGAIASAIGRARRKALLGRVAGSRSHKSLEAMSWREFEMLVGEAFRARGFRVRETPPGADGGVDLVLDRDGDRFLVQCKQWKAQTVGVSVVRELYGVMAAQGAKGGYVVTSGRFTAEAAAFARGKPIELMDGPALHELIRDVEPPPAGAPRPRAAVDAGPPACPVCTGAMVKRVAKKGANAGAPFWGCSNWPSCRGTRPAPQLSNA